MTDFLLFVLDIYCNYGCDYNYKVIILKNHLFWIQLVLFVFDTVVCLSHHSSDACRLFQRLGDLLLVNSKETMAWNEALCLRLIKLKYTKYKLGS